MIEKAIKRFPIDMDRSWIIGDSFRDIQMAHNAGMYSILILSGEDWKTVNHVNPLFTAVNLYDAVSMITRIQTLLGKLSSVPFDVGTNSTYLLYILLSVSSLQSVNSIMYHFLLPVGPQDPPANVSHHAVIASCQLG